MNGTKYLLDTCTLIGLHKQTAESLQLLNQQKVQLSECAISIITYIEFIGFYGVDKSTTKQLKQIAQHLKCYVICDDIRDLTINIRQQHKIKLPDALILATAKTHNLQLLTLDEKLQRISESLEKE